MNVLSIFHRDFFMKLSICISTFNRARFIGATLKTIIPQLDENTELVIVDGGSTDDTPKVMQEFLDSTDRIRYFRFEENRGFDHDLDQAVQLALGEYCWLMSDDDLIYPDALKRIHAALQARKWEAIVLNYEVYTLGFEKLISGRKINVERDKIYRVDQLNEFFVDTAAALSYLGALIIKKTIWLTRERTRYFGSYFIHMGILFQANPSSECLVMADPLIKIRYGNAQWTHRAFEIWMFKWPEIIWNAYGVSPTAKASVCPRKPWTDLKRLAILRALGAYNIKEYHKFIAPQATRTLNHFKAYLLALIPGAIINSVAVLFYGLQRRDKVMLLDLQQSRYCVLKKFTQTLAS
jgi:glycosyltransferase involved in cell wall biosynthesis